MIQILKGTYGVKRLTAKSGPVTLSAVEEKRLVSLGIAEYVTAPETPVQGVNAGKPAENADSAPETSGEVSDKGDAEKPAENAAETPKKANKAGGKSKGKAANKK